MLSFAVIAVLLVAYCQGAPSNLETLPDGRIVGGNSTTIDKYPYQLSLRVGDRHICGATLVAPKWAVTAAHCTDGSNVASLSVRAGSTYRTSGGTIVEVKKIYQHPQYNKFTTDYDVSVLELVSEVNDSNAATIGLAASNSDVAAGAIATVTGWGYTRENGVAANTLQVVELPIVSLDSCRDVYGNKAITDRMICAGVPQGGKDSCQGDSGGPLVVNGVLTGIVSWGEGCARPKQPGVYASVPSLRSYIDSVIN